MPERYLEPFNQGHIDLLSDFCVVEKDEYDYFKDYLFTRAWIDNEQGIAKTIVYIEETEANGKIEKKLLGFYAIRCSSLIIGSLDGGEKVGEPALEIVELAVHKNYRSQGIGTEMMKDIFATANKLKNDFLGIKHLVVCAKGAAKTYYEGFNFKEIPGYQKIPRSYDNQSCVGMSVRLSFK